MHKKLYYLLPFLLVIILFAQPATGLKPDKNFPPAPDFTLTDLEGNEISLSDCKGKVTFLNFWATWCSPCRAEIPGFVEVYTKYKDKGMEIIGISVDSAKIKKVRDFAKKYKINYPVAMYTMDLVRDYEPGRAIPSTIIIDQKGIIRHRHIGYMDKEILEKYFLKLTEEK